MEVGADLYELDTEAEATVVADEASSEPTAAVETSAPAPPVAAAAATTSTPEPVAQVASHRTPSIHFLGKEGWALRRSGGGASTVIYGVPPGYGRPVFTEDEMDALMTGGANLAPDVKGYSSGAVFSY